MGIYAPYDPFGQFTDFSNQTVAGTPPINPVSSGLLGPAAQQAIRSRGLLGLAAGLLQASGPSRMPVNLGAALGQGAVQGMQASDAEREAQLNQALLIHKMKGEPYTLGQGDVRYGSDNREIARGLPVKTKDERFLTTDEKKRFGVPEESVVTVDSSGNYEIKFPPKTLATQTVNVGAKNVGLEQIQKEDAKTVVGLRDDAKKARMTLGNLAKMKESINSEAGVYSGSFADQRTGLANFFNTLGIPGVDVDKLANSQMTIAESNQLALSILKTYVGSTQISDKDVQMVASTIPRLSQNPKARIELINFLEKRSRETISLADRADKHFRGKGRGSLADFDWEPKMTIKDKYGL